MGKKRSNQTGSLRKREDRKKVWQAQVSLPNGKKITKSFERERDALEWIKETNRKIQSGLNMDLAMLLFAAVLFQWLALMKETWAISTHREYERIVKQYVLPNLPKNLKFGAVSHNHILSLFQTAQEKNIGIRSRQLMKSVLHKFFEDYKARIGLQVNPLDGIQIRYKPHPINFFTKEESLCFIRAARQSPRHALYYTALSTGMREGELLGLVWKSIDFASGSISLTQQIQRSNEGLVFCRLKTSYSRRRIDIGHECVEILREHKAYQDLVRAAAGSAWQDNDLVFTTSIGTPIDARNLLREFKRVLAIAGLQPLRFHDLRHTHATLLLLANVHPKVVSERLGHSDVRITLQLYSHVIPTLQKEAARTIDLILTDKNEEGFVDS